MMHGHSPRVRRRYNQENGEEEKVVSVDKEKLLDRAVGAAIGAVIGTAVTGAIQGRNDG